MICASRIIRILCMAFLMVLIFRSNVIAETKAEFTLPSGVNVQIVEVPFNKANFNIDERCYEIGAGCFINGQVPFGIVSHLPKTYVKSIQVTFKGHSYSLDSSNMYNAWGTRPLEYKGTIRYFGGNCFNEKYCQFRGLFADAGAAYVAEWRIANGKSIRTVLTSSNDVINLFMKNIDPPVFE